MIVVTVCFCSSGLNPTLCIAKSRVDPTENRVFAHGDMWRRGRWSPEPARMRSRWGRKRWKSCDSMRRHRSECERTRAHGGNLARMRVRQSVVHGGDGGWMLTGMRVRWRTSWQVGYVWTELTYEVGARPATILHEQLGPVRQLRGGQVTPADQWTNRITYAT